MPEDKVLLLERRHPGTIEARVVRAEGPSAQIRLRTDAAVCGGRIYRIHGEGMRARTADLGEIVPHPDGVLRPGGVLAPDWHRRIPDVLRVVLAVPSAEAAPDAGQIRFEAGPHGLLRRGRLEALSDVDDAPVLDIVLRPNGVLAAREWQPQRRVPSDEPGAMAVRGTWTPWTEARLPDDDDARRMRRARGPGCGFRLEEGYWAHLNARMEDPFTIEGDPWLADTPHRVRGGQDLLDELLTLAAWADPETAESLPGILAVAAARPDADGSVASLSLEDSTVVVCPGLAAHAAAILARLEPSGASVSCNDGPSRRRSGYDTTDLVHAIEIPAASAHERLDAARRLAARMVRHAADSR
jgi:hypothetical protein